MRGARARPGSGVTVQCNLCTRIFQRDPLFVVEWPQHVWFLADDQTWPGWSMLVLKRHAVELFELEPQERADAMEEVARAARILSGAFSASKMNVELLGNVEPHIHWHVIPRHTDDAAWNKPIWTHVHEPVRPAAHILEALVRKIRTAITSA